MRLRILFLLLAFVAVALNAQEPRPADLAASILEGPGIQLTLPWRFAPGDAPGRELPQCDDSRWATLAPGLETATGWAGVGWFRRHILLDAGLQNRPLGLTFAAPGAGDVYVDGELVSSFGRSGSPPLIPAERREVKLVTFRGRAHVIAVRYVYPANVARPSGGFGFRLTLERPEALAPAPVRNWVMPLRGAIAALPIVLALLHFALFAFDRRARENLFYALEMVAFTAIVVHEYESAFFPLDIQPVVSRICTGAPMLAVLFGLLTYYAIRTKPYPRTWRPIVAIGVALFAASYFVPAIGDYGWIGYFALMLGEIVHVEHSCPNKVERSGTGFALVSFAILSVAIVLQVFVNFGLLQSIAGIREVYVFGIVASAVGMSLYLAHSLGRSRVIELENERKTHELTRARQLQLSMLPRELPSVPGLDVAVATQTAAEVGGDYYDVRRDGDDALLFAFGDATGHGLASGIVVTAAKALFTSISPDGSLAAHLGDFDRALRSMRLPGQLRMCLSLARISRSEAVVASAAMPPILIRRATGIVDELGYGDVPLGGRLSARYEERRTSLATGDTLLLATDGFAEQAGTGGRQLGYDGLAEALARVGGAASAQAVLDGLFAVASQFRGSQPQADDITLVVVRVSD